jgi:hypothetical protein
VRTYSALGTMLAKDPYCEVYKAVFGRAETHARKILRSRLVTDVDRSAKLEMKRDQTIRMGNIVGSCETKVQ